MCKITLQFKATLIDHIVCGIGSVYSYAFGLPVCCDLDIGLGFCRVYYHLSAFETD